MTNEQVTYALALLEESRRLAKAMEEGELSMSEGDELRTDVAFEALDLLEEIIYRIDEELE